MFACCCAPGEETAVTIPTVSLEEEYKNSLLQEMQIMPAQEPDPVPSVQLKKQAEEISATKKPKAPVLEEAREFTVTINKDTGIMGVVLDRKEHWLTVIKVASGLIADHNARVADKADCVLVNDFIVAVNGKRHVDDMLEEAKLAGGSVDILVHRPYRFEVIVSKSDSQPSFGAALMYQQDSTSVDVKSIRPGALQVYNEKVPTELQVLPSDCITQVDGKASSPPDMITAIKEQSTVRLTIIRPPIVACGSQKVV
mmetsp:Transcript_10585/g.23353  ORF Transcript_10585/g.23353 Transcript_10585/m.23353 type:complete len:255 (+) Transcript_10585:260-1024(+)|eukprot:CAMPEP_0206492176 /NCGR_PEP_ID=MMETSP0324_2-20121206/45793_1 /ASSEMBLY_ACC=CAM_ASM_000836 /TAXON_ID=2866 /ORGANISM="Crypthecodinium cohnii, Strain Seligo" /LENGTH=254 /DNA_ID=CAMNT_0053974223 /DNA_START=196 /DNA_END=960 /DNA_ORIENTATION=+